MEGRGGRPELAARGARPSPDEFGFVSCDAFVPANPNENTNPAEFCDPEIA